MFLTFDAYIGTTLKYMEYHQWEPLTKPLMTLMHIIVRGMVLPVSNTTRTEMLFRFLLITQSVTKRSSGCWRRAKLSHLYKAL